MPDSSTNYTAAFAIVNEQGQYVNLTYVNISGTNASYLDMWVHGNRSVDAPSEAADAAVQIVDNGNALFSASDTVWTLAPGDGNVDTISADYGASGGQTHLPCVWDTGANMWYNDFSGNFSLNKTSDFVWVQICLDIDKDAAISGSASLGTIYFHFKASQ